MDFPEVDVSEEPMQIDSSDNDSVISTRSGNYSFIPKKQGKKPIGGGRISIALPIEIANILFSEEEVEDFSEISSDKDEDLFDQEIDFNAPAIMFENINQKESIDINNNFMWEFSNYPMANQRFLCNYLIAKKISTSKGDIYKPSSIYPIASLSHQLQSLFNKKGFEESYPEEDLPFFRKELSDSHLGLMINLDWFQPFQNSQYGIGAIYDVICNLSRDERFKPSNILTLVLIPAPIMDQLIGLWDGIELERTFESSIGKFIRVAKSAERGGFADMSEWFVERNIDIIRQDAIL
ncbi:4337_t:CDS:2 [Ambispora leptoticha]|uniref:4337_t:CDS:1 n=1 Tax=Ambispora leptoticha TaxID=144679 RepID=A0A9N9D8W2_9GLOM|nr:4337_t:CDS:2 [Ambispora leptoticha]